MAKKSIKDEYQNAADVLTGREIVKMRAAGKVTIQPYHADQLGPNSYTYRLGSKLGVPEIGMDGKVTFKNVTIPKEGYVLKPGLMYLGHTHEKLGSDSFVMSLVGRQDTAALGLCPQVDADLGHTGACHKWTLEIVAAMPVRLYPRMKIGEIAFRPVEGDTSLYTGGYARFNGPRVSKHVKPR